MNDLQAQPVVSVELDKPRKLVFDFNALCEFERVTGKNSLSADLWTSTDAGTLRALLYAALKTHHPEVTLQEVGGMLNLGNAQAVTDALVEAFNRSASSESGGKKKAKAQ